jgi:hypothetical protein
MARFSSFAQFYPYYLHEHRNRTCRRLHFFGSWCVLGCLFMAFWQQQWGWGVAALVCGYGLAWVGHFFFEKNRPATFSHPLYSLAGDWVMFADILRGRLPF